MNQLGDIVLACQFDCEPENYDDKGYCRHLVGFTTATDKKRFHPRRIRRGENGEVISEFVDGSKPQPVHPKDILVRITGSDRVYRDVDKIKPDWDGWIESNILEAVA